MTYRLIESGQAKKDLEQIISYLAEHLDNKTAALDFLEELAGKYQTLSKSPYLYPLSRVRVLSEKGLRVMPVKNYVVLYKVFDEPDEVAIHNIVYGRRDFLRIL